MMRFRTFSLIATAVFNGIVTVMGTIYFNYYAAAIGIGLSICLGSITMMMFIAISIWGLKWENSIKMFLIDYFFARLFWE